MIAMDPVMRATRARPAGHRRLYVCYHAVPDLPVPATFSVARLAALLTERGGGRPAYVVAMRNGPRWARAWVADEEAEWIVYRQAAPRGLRIWYTVHQAAHLLLGHAGAQVSADIFGDLLFPRLNRALGQPGGRRVRLTCGLATGEEEREALPLAAEVMCAASGVRAGGGR